MKIEENEEKFLKIFVKKDEEFVKERKVEKNVEKNLGELFWVVMWGIKVIYLVNEGRIEWFERRMVWL